MKKLEHERGNNSERFIQKTISRRQFFKNAIAGAGMITALQAGVFTTALIMPRDARAQEVEIEGKRLTISQLSRSLADLDRDSAQYRDSTHEHMSNRENNYIYSNDINVPGRVTFLVRLGQQSNQRELIVNFPARLEKSRNAPTPGSRSIDMGDFPEYMRRVSGQNVAKIKFILEMGTFDQNGRTYEYTNAYLFPMDSQGNLLTRRGSGQHIVYVSTYYTTEQENVAYGGYQLLVEPNNRDTIASR